MNVWNSPYNILARLISTVYYIYSILGSEYNDIVTFSPGFAISQQFIGVADLAASDVQVFYPFDGILG